MTAAVPAGLVAAALAAARDRDQPVAEVPLTAIAAAAGISRSTLLRRLGGTRSALDDAVRDSGVDPGGRPPVRERAIEAAAHLIGERGLGGVTLDAVAAAAGCSLPSLHATFDGRDGLLAAVFERYSPVLDLRALAAEPPDRLEETIRAIYRALLTALHREPRVIPAIFGDLFSRPDGPASRLVRANGPALLQAVRLLLMPEVAAGRLRPLPFPLLAQLLVGPLVFHSLTRPVLEAIVGDELPDVTRTCEVFADAFLRAAAKPRAGHDATLDVDGGGVASNLGSADDQT
ncbi:TetR/AcrR family transcriptional regulator [Micromonospora sp. KC213]|uniref:TetR/AcrR family transcriptional regulator n=1 Tax=Micromonospora sp. KC213 TaxID=2530378 RepID=UPI00104E7C3D|nr:TetR/AcrR family transcriptional regulator [Micromonospora sp. KC213]TDC39694.1 TetR/AcrR family transcriptional regulator [Micromonospora sp. KC213]